MEGDTYHSEHLCRGRRILRLPHAGGSAQFHDTSFLMTSKGWFVVAVQLFGVVSMTVGSKRGRTRVRLPFGDKKKTPFAQHTNDKIGCFEVVRFVLKVCVLCPASIRA